MLLFGSRAGAVEITLDPALTFQTISGWEATADLPDNPADPAPAYREELLDRLVSEVGINRLRLEIRSGAENVTDQISRHISGELDFRDWKDTRYDVVNDNDDPFEINWDGFDFAELDWHVENTILPVRERLRARGEELIVNLCMVSFNARPTFHQEPEEYAEFVLATYLHLQEKYGFVPDLWEVVLEPDLLKGNGWTPETLGKVMAATSRRLRAHGFTPGFVAPSVTNMGNAVRYVEGIARVPGAMEDFVELSYHRYRGRKLRNLQAIVATANKHGLRTAMTEWWFGRADHEVLHEDLTVGNVAAFQGRVVEGHFSASGGTLTVKPEIRFNQQYFRHVRHGAVRIGAATDAPGTADPVAFVNTDGRHVVVVKAGRAVQVTVSGLPEGRYRVSYAIERGSVALPDPITVGGDGRLETEIPAAGVLTIAAE